MRIINMEIWKPIDNNYLVSSLGRVMNKRGRVLTQRTEFKDKYPKVRLYGKNVRVHRLVAKIFILNPDNKETVNHINGKKYDNRVENLEWATRSENIQHAYRTGLIIPLDRDKINTTKIKNNDIGLITTKYLSGIRKSEIAKEYNVKIAAIGEILKLSGIKSDDRSTFTGKEKQKNYLKTVSKTVFQFDNNSLLNEFSSILEAEKITGVSRKSIRNSIKENRKSCGFIWKLKN